ncbi:MAG TPA: 1,4-dihydroxy-2-naphthoate polyprenyltransferase, partial [Polyangiaceae bacterium]|nr:1,4-dihydroxy-2-naphthoate polyprenyltransferase [Polyangiaceae bacterium]
MDTSPRPRAEAPGAIGAWVQAIRPATLTAALGPVAVGTGLAIADGAFDASVALAALLGATFIQIGTNLYNDYADFMKGADTDERLGPARAVQRGWLGPRAVKVGALLAFAVASLFGAYLIHVAGWPILVIGVLSLVSGVLYTGGPAPLAYTGLGDLFVLAFFGLAAVGGTYYAQAKTIVPEALAGGVAVGLLATAILVVNNLRDRHTDHKAGKRTLVVRFGEAFGRREYVGCIVGAYVTAGVVTVATVLRGEPSWGWLAPLLSMPLAVVETRRVMAADGAALNPRLGGTARLGLIYALL